MTNSEFNKFFNQVVSELKILKDYKGLEYTKTEDRFSNFKDQSWFNNTCTLDALRGNWSKHIISIKDMLSNEISSPGLYNTKQWKDKLYDNIMYSILCLALMSKRGYKNE